MASRLLLVKCLERANLIRPLVANGKQQIVRNKSSMRPAQTLTNSPSMFSPTVLKKYYEITPLVVIMGGAVLGLGYCIVRSFFTRDDLRFSNDSKMLCELETEDPRKFRVYNQKYKAPEGLKEALDALKEPAPKAN